MTETEQATGANPVIVKTTYDALGRVASTSLPSDDGSYRYASFSYDALDRVTSKTWDDGASEQTQYQVAEMGVAAEQTKATDAAGKWRVLATDALGRLVRVREPAGSGGAAVETGYAYDSLNNLLSVDEGGRMRNFAYDALGRLLSASNPESGTISYVYDNNGNLTQKTDARGGVTSYAYDWLNRPLTKYYSGGASAPAVAWVWDTLKKGKLTSVEAGNANNAGGSKTTFAYDAAARILSSTQRTEGVNYDFEYRYHKGWGLRQVKYPSGRWVRYTPDAAGRPVTVARLTSGEALDKTYWDGAQYAPQGALKQVTLGNGLMEKWSFNAQRQQPYDVRLGAAGNEGSHLRLQFAYCANNYSGGSCGTNNGNILAQWNYETNHIEKYGYDAVNRLSSATDYVAAPNGWSQSYSYDRFGNRWVSANGVLPMDARTPTSQSDIDATNNRLMGANYAYDSAGNQTKHGGWTLAYDAENRVSTSQPSGGNATTYAYDGEGRRVKKTTNGVSTWFVYDASGNLAAEYLVSAPSSALVTQFVTTDHLGSTRLVTDATGNVVSRHDYLPFGEEIPAGYGGRTAAMKYVANPALTQRFTGKERDTETGLDYFLARYMSSVQGRFTSPDKPFADQTPFDPQSWNLYSYTRNNPLKYVDENGRELKIAIYNNSGFNRPTAERAGQHIARKFEQAGVKNVTFEVRSGAPGLGAVAGAFARSVGSFITGKQHSATLDLRSSRVSANGYAHDITPGRTGENESGIAAVDTSQVPQPTPGLVGPPDPAVEIGNLGAHEIAHDVFVGHPDDDDRTNIMHPSADPDVVTNPNLNFSPAQAEALRRRFNTAKEQRQMEEERNRP